MRRPHTLVSILTAVVLAAVTALTAGPAWVASSQAATGHPTSIAALGDSITRGFNAGGWYSDWPSPRIRLSSGLRTMGAIRAALARRWDPTTRS